jgi:multiple sugar transport system substrate-binding protein
MGIYFIWKFAKNKEAAKQYLVDQQLAYNQHFTNSQFYNFPAWTNAVKGGFKGIYKATAADKHKPLGKYTVLAAIAQKYTTNIGYPGFANAAVGDIFNQFLVPQMFAQVTQGKMSAADAAKSMQSTFSGIYRKWRNQGLL